MVIERVLARVELSASDARDEWALPQHITLVPARGTRLSIRHRHDPPGTLTDAYSNATAQETAADNKAV
jgi:hypothetical protein